MTFIMRMFILFFIPFTAMAQSVVNVYAWTGEIPDYVIRQFEKETGIKVNFSEYENNEIMYAKLRASPKVGYDVIIPSSNVVDRMSRLGMLKPLNKSLLPNWKNINPHFLNPSFDPESKYSVPFIWGVTGIFVNDAYYSPQNITKWSDLWKSQFTNRLLMLDDVRDAFSITFMTLGYPVNDQNPVHIKTAFLKLKKLMNNVKVFSTDTVVSIIIDEDATVGMAWNGDAYKASRENKHIKFIYPQDGFTIWIDNLAIPKNAPHEKEAHQFINFMLRPDVAKAIALYTGYPIANLAGQKLLPDDIQNNPTVYPSREILRHGQYQLDLPNDTLALYEKYWEELKMGE